MFLKYCSTNVKTMIPFCSVITNRKCFKGIDSKTSKELWIKNHKYVNVFLSSFFHKIATVIYICIILRLFSLVLGECILVLFYYQVVSFLFVNVTFKIISAPMRRANK